MGDHLAGPGPQTIPGLTFIDVAGRHAGAAPGEAASHLDEGGPCPVVAMGVFDGIHLGHRSLLERAFAEARARRAPFWVLTFWPHPATVVGPAPSRGYLLTTLQEKVGLLRDVGADRVVGLRFTPQAAAVEPEEFFRGTLQPRLAPQVLVVGFNFSFGRGGRGNPALLKELAGRAGVEVIVHPAVRVSGEVVSSSAVRKALADGNVEKAGFLLGRPHSLAGPVERGAGRGRKLGFPTANVDYPPEAAGPAPGVYVVAVQRGLDPRPDLRDAQPGVANIGTCPTFTGEAGPVTGKAGRLEVHLLAPERPPAYGEPLRVFFLRRLRAERRFASPEELADQIRRDCDEAFVFFGMKAGATGPASPGVRLFT